LAKRAAELNKKDYQLARAFGAALYRAKKFEEAVKQLEAAAASRKQPSPSVWLLLAMAHQQCKRENQAKEFLSKARDWMTKARGVKASDAGKDVLTWDRLPWTERLALELLETEAGKLIEGGSPS
jgi:Tfp pilus assembly protein PilF